MTDVEPPGGAHCLDFVNTLGDRPRCREEGLTRPEDLIAWAEQARLVTRPQARQLRAWIRRSPRVARRALARAVSVRECLYRVFSASASGRPPRPQDLARINTLLAKTLGRQRVRALRSRYTWTWADDDAVGFDRVLWPVIRSAADLLTSPDLPRVRECASGVCSWVFVDRSRTGKRRWCSMSTCGNRDKVRRFYERRQRRLAAGA